MNTVPTATITPTDTATIVFTVCVLLDMSLSTRKGTRVTFGPNYAHGIAALAIAAERAAENILMPADCRHWGGLYWPNVQ
jgi:hypothetical protein